MSLFLQVTAMTNERVGELATNFSTLIWIAVATLAAIFGWLYWIKQKNPELTFGDLFAKMLYKEKFTFFLLLTFLINFAEALFAASIHTVGEVQINPLARFLTHLSIQMMSLVASIFAAKLLQEHMERDVKEAVSRRNSRIIMLIFTLAVALLFPYFNLLLISGGLRETHHLAALLSGKAGVEAWIRMSYAMQATLVSTITHYFLVTLDSAYTIYQAKEPVKNASLYDVNASINNRDAANQQADLDKFSDTIRWLLLRYSYSGRKLEAKLLAANSAIDRMKDPEKIKLSNKCATLVRTIEKWEKDRAPSMSDEDKKKQKHKFLQDIFNVFKDTTAGGKGFGMQLSQLPNNPNP